MAMLDYQRAIPSPTHIGYTPILWSEIFVMFNPLLITMLGAVLYEGAMGLCFIDLNFQVDDWDRQSCTLGTLGTLASWGKL